VLACEISSVGGGRRAAIYGLVRVRTDSAQERLQVKRARIRTSFSSQACTIIHTKGLTIEGFLRISQETMRTIEQQAVIVGNQENVELTGSSPVSGANFPSDTQTAHALPITLSFWRRFVFMHKQRACHSIPLAPLVRSFQSAPRAFARGDTSIASATHACIGRFNPRPAHSHGATFGELNHETVDKLFQSAPRVFTRGDSRWWRQTCARGAFQSAPRVFTRGDHHAAFPPHQPYRVSIRAPRVHAGPGVWLLLD